MSDKEKETNVETFANDNLVVIVTRKPNCQVEFEITVNPTATEAAHQKAFKTVTKEVSIPGFRKGKAPAHFITERYASAIKEEFMDVVLQNAFNDALMLTHLHPLKNTVKAPLVKECTREKGAHFIIKFEARLNPPDIDIESLKVKRVTPHVISEKDSKDAIQQLLYRMSEFIPVTDRPVQENDFVNLQVILFGELPRSIENSRIQVNADSLPNWLYKKVLGLKIGEVVEGMTEVNDDKNESLEIQQPVPFKATLVSIWQAKVPELNDELAKKIGVESVQDLEEKMKERMEQTASIDAFDQQVNLIERALLDKYTLDIPKSYLDEEFKIRMEEYLQPLLEQGVGNYVEEHRHSIEEQIRKISVDRLAIYFMLHVVAMKNNIQPTQEEIGIEFERQRSLMAINRSNLSANNQQELEKQLYNLATEQKIKQFLLDKVTYIED